MMALCKDCKYRDECIVKKSLGIWNDIVSEAIERLFEQEYIYCEVNVVDCRRYEYEDERA